MKTRKQTFYEKRRIRSPKPSFTKMYWHLMLRNYPLKLSATAVREHDSARQKSWVIEVVHLFLFCVVKLWVLCTEIYSDFHIWDVRYQIVKRAWVVNKSKCNDPQLWKYIYLEESLLLGVIQEPAISWMLVHFTVVTPWKEKTMMKPSAILYHTCSIAIEKCPTSVS